MQSELYANLKTQYLPRQDRSKQESEEVLTYMSITTTKKKVDQLNLNEYIVTDVNTEGSSGKTYESGDGIIVDNINDVIKADYRDISATMHEMADYFTLSSDVQAELEKSYVNISGEPAKEIGQLTLSGDFTIGAGAKFNLISGNYYQTDDTRYVKNFSSKNAFVQAECSEKYYGRYGIACTGSRGYCILSATKAGSPYGTGSLKLSGDLGDLVAFHAISANALFSLTLNSGAKSMAYQISAINGQWVYLNTIIEVSLPVTTDEADYIELWETGEDNGFYCPSRPDVGNAVIPSMYGNHIEGAATKALQRCTHAEGRNTISDIRYSHSEGSDTVAGGMYSHAEGHGSKALGNASHAEGKGTTALGEASHAEGSSTKTTGKSTHAEGTSTEASGIGAHAEGERAVAYGKGAHAEGYLNYALGPYSHAEGDGYCYAGTMAFNIVSADVGLSTLTLDSLSCNAGSLTESKLLNKWLMIFQRATTDGNVSATFQTKFLGVVAGKENTISVSYVPEFRNSYANANAFFPDYPLYGTTSLGSGAHAQGYQSHAMEDSTAFGCNNYALGRYSFALGNANKADYMGIAIGSGNSAFGQHSIAMGGTGSADASALEANTQVFARKAFGWSGNGKYVVPIERTGTFNINPVNGARGIYIGDKTLYDIIVEIAKTQLK